jgi:hypothetical protein
VRSIRSTRKPLARYGAMEGALARGLLHCGNHEGVNSSRRKGVDSERRLTTLPQRRLLSFGRQSSESRPERPDEHKEKEDSRPI